MHLACFGKFLFGVFADRCSCIAWACVVLFRFILFKHCSINVFEYFFLKRRTEGVMFRVLFAWREGADVRVFFEVCYAKYFFNIGAELFVIDCFGFL